MEIVINIPEKVYSYVNTQWRDIPKNDSPISIMCNAVIDGTPLPKGHGRLIDESKIEVCEWVNELEEDYPKASTTLMNKRCGT